MMNMISREYIQKPARAINPNVKIINKFPQWYDRFHERGYEVTGEIESYDITWVGTETRDNDFVNDSEGLNLPQYGAYYIMRWLKDLGKEKTEGGWFDALGTTEKTYLEQARQTVLADATEQGSGKGVAFRPPPGRSYDDADGHLRRSIQRMLAHPGGQ